MRKVKYVFFFAATLWYWALTDGFIFALCAFFAIISVVLMLVLANYIIRKKRN